MLESRLLHASAVVRIADVVCRAARGGRGPDECSPRAQVVIPRRGVFTVHGDEGGVTADPMTAVVLHGMYRISHPADGGDRCTVFEFAPDVHEEALRDARLLRPRQRLIALRAPDALAADERAMALLAALACAPPLRRTPAAEEVRGLLAADPAAPWTLARIAAAVHRSPYHLARAFRAGTGESISRYLLGLRLAAAADRLQQGDDDLARLAADLGFSSHSHFSERFRHWYGAPPSKMRTILTAGRRRGA